MQLELCTQEVQVLTAKRRMKEDEHARFCELLAEQSMLSAYATTPLTLSLLSVIALVAILVADIGLVVGISGALLGASLCYVFPALMYGAAQQHKFEARGFEPTRAERLASSLVALLVPFGAFLGILGVAMTVKGA